MRAILAGLIIHEQRIRANLLHSSSLISTEALMFVLAEKIGKQAAHQILYDVTIEGRNQADSLIDRLYAHPEIQNIFSRELLEQTVDPAKHTGLSGQITDRIVAAAKEMLSTPIELTSVSLTCPLENSAGSCRIIDGEVCS
jgi:adenylosuccinate lyase